MKNTIKILISLSLIVLCLLLMASCADTLDEINEDSLKLDTDTLTLTWDRVLGAKSYTIQITGQDFEKSSKQPKYSL